MFLKPRMLRLLTLLALLGMLVGGLAGSQTASPAAAAPVTLATQRNAPASDPCPTPPSAGAEQIVRGQRPIQSNQPLTTTTPTSTPATLFGWDNIAPMPSLRGRAVAQPWSDGNIYVFGGRDFDIDWQAGFTIYRPDASIYNTVSNNWTSISSVFPEGRLGTNTSDMQSAVLTDSNNLRHIYLLGGSGYSEQITNTVFTYDPGSASAVSLPDADNWPVGRRIAGGSAVVGNKWYVFGGIIKPFSTYTDTWVFDPLAASGSRWTRLTNANLSVPRGYIASVVLDGKIYAVAGGQLSPSGTAISNEAVVERFDPANPALGWVRLADLPSGRSYAHAFAWDTGSGQPYAGKIVVAGGRWDIADTNAYIYDPLDNTWSVFAGFNSPRRTYAAAQYNGKWFAFGGHGTVLESRTSGGQTVSAIGFIITSESYPGSTLAPTPTATPTAPPEGYWQIGAPLASARYRFNSVVANGKLYAIGGLGGSCYDTQQNFNESYDPTLNQWSVLAPRPRAAGTGASGYWNGNIYVAGGVTPRSPSGLTNPQYVTYTTSIYSTTANSWTVGVVMSAATGGAASEIINGKLYAVGGDHNITPYTSNTNYIFDIAAGSWSTGPALGYNTAYASGGMMNGELYVVGGFNSSFSGAINSVSVYSPTANAWRTAAPLQQARQGATVFAYNSELWAVGGGAGSDGFTLLPSSQSVEIYNPTSNTWRYGPRLNVPRLGAAGGNINGVAVVSAGFGDGTILVGSERIPGLAPTPTWTPLVTDTPTSTSTPTSTGTLTATSTPISSDTPTVTSTPLLTSTPTATLTATATLTVTATPCAISFSDVPTGSLFYGDITFLYCRGIINGYGGNTFRPAASTTRGQFAKMIVNGLGLPAFTPTSPTFSDVPATQPFYTYIEAAVRAGVIAGYPGGTFRPNNPIRRDESAVIIQRAKGYPSFNPPSPTYADLPSTAFGYAAVEALTAVGVVNGQTCGTASCFNPSSNIRRDELSRIVRRAIEINPLK